MEIAITRRGLRVEVGAVVKDCKPEVGIRQGKIMQVEGRKAIIQWGPGERSSHISIDQIHQSSVRKSGYRLLHNWSPMRRHHEHQTS